MFWSFLLVSFLSCCNVFVCFFFRPRCSCLFFDATFKVFVFYCLKSSKIFWSSPLFTVCPQTFSRRPRAKTLLLQVVYCKIPWNCHYKPRLHKKEHVKNWLLQSSLAGLSASSVWIVSQSFRYFSAFLVKMFLFVSPSSGPDFSGGCFWESFANFSFFSLIELFE